MALDWARTFDSVNPIGLCDALRRFGIPVHYINMIKSIYTDRQFLIQEMGISSDLHCQDFGISQGCPLSPFLCIILMTIVMHDAKSNLLDKGWQLNPKFLLHDLLYADDTLLIEVDVDCLQTYMQEVARYGKEYGLALNWDKIEVLPIRCNPDIKDPDGHHKENKSSILYLGALITSDGRITAELNRRLGMAQADFKILDKTWNHTNLSRTTKFEIFQTLILNKLLYALEAAWLTKTERRHLDGFFAKSVRRIMGIRPSYFSRIANKTIYREFGILPLSAILLRRQIIYYGKLTRLPDDAILRRFLFDPHTTNLRNGAGKNRQGRPRQRWTKEIHTHALRLAGSKENLEHLIEQSASWAAAVRAYCVHTDV